MYSIRPPSTSKVYLSPEKMGVRSQLYIIAILFLDDHGQAPLDSVVEVPEKLLERLALRSTARDGGTR
jgi:hypothetical protein